MNIYRSRHYIAIPPGATIKEMLEDRGMSQKEFAYRMGLTEKHISKLINGEVHLTVDVAIKLERVIGMNTRFWTGLEANYREEIILSEEENNALSDTALAKKFPYKEMASLGWVPEVKTTNEKIVELRKFFGVTDLDLLKNGQLVRIITGPLSLSKKSDLALMAWAQQAKNIAFHIDAEPINIRKLNAAIPAIREMSSLRPKAFCGKLKEILTGYGVVLVLNHRLKDVSVHSATVMFGNKIVIAIDPEGMDTGRFWFDLFRELGHIILGHVKITGGISADDEQDAVVWSEDNLIAKVELNRFKEEGDYTERSVRRFAGILGIAPGIVVGRLQSDGVISEDELNDLKVAM